MKYCNILTGGIGCGKSTVANMLIDEGYEVIFADKISSIVLSSKTREIEQEFGSGVVEGGVINKARLGNIIFSDEGKRKKLESILHGDIRAKVLEQCKMLEKKDRDYFLELPLYFESSYEYANKCVICVYASRDLQIQRVMSRNNLAMQEAIKRVDSQIDIEIKRAKSDFVLDNSGGLDELKVEFQKLLLFLKSVPKNS